MNFLRNILERLRSLTEDNSRWWPASPDEFLHETGHVIITKLFDETLTLEFVTLDGSIARKYGVSAFGGVKANYVKDADNRTIHDFDKVVLVALAGFCVDELIDKSRVISSHNYYIWLQSLNYPKYSGDLELATQNFARLSSCSLTWSIYITSCMECLFKILNDDCVWKGLHAIRHKLYESSNHTLTSDEIDRILVEVGFDKWKERNKPDIIMERTRVLSSGNM